jgi:hypothetical protein
MNLKALLLLISIFLVFRLSFAQNENNIWYFGQNAGLDFNSGTPVPLTNGALNTSEGCASVADKTSGQLLFYTDGVKVWNKNHTVMPNGTGLWGDISSTQSAHIVPKPGSDTLYYIFTTDAGTSGFPNGGVMAYSVVDMSLASGNGDVIIKNVALFDITSEHLTATLDSSGCNIWVLAHEWNTDAFYAYLVSDTGVSSTPVISNAGSIHNCGYYGQMKVSPDGKKLALPLPCDLSNNYYVELLDFDNKTGVVSNMIQLPQDHLTYGLEFSPSSQYLYIVDHNNDSAIIYKQTAQYDVSLDSADIIASRVIVGATYNSTTFSGGAAQLAPDGKIYVVPTYSDSLSVINYPDSAGLACNFVVAGLYLGGKFTDHGLPGKVVTANPACGLPLVSLASSDTTMCEKQCIDFFDQSLNNPVSWQWIFEGASTSISSDQHPLNICYDDTGTFDVTLITTDAVGNSDTLTLPDFITVFTNPFAPVITQSGNTLTSSAAYSYQWYLNGTLIAGATNQSYEITQSGLYTVIITDENGCSAQTDFDAGVTSVDEMVSGSIAVYPNPSNGNFTVEWSNGFMVSWLSIKIENELGQKIFSYQENISSSKWKKEINLTSVASGIYFIKIKTEEGLVREKVIVTE